MSTVAQPSPAAPSSAVAEERETLAGDVREWVAGLRSGELGSLPIIVGMVIIAIYFQSRNSHFLTAGNMVNLITQMAAYCVIGMGIVFVLLLEGYAREGEAVQFVVRVANIRQRP